MTQPQGKKKIRKQTMHWKMRNGKKIRVCDMTDGHLDSTIKMISRNFRGVLYKQWIMLLNYLGNDPPDGATTRAESEIYHLEGILFGNEDYQGADVTEVAQKELPILRAMVREKQRRKDIRTGIWNKVCEKGKRYDYKGKI